LLLLLLLTGCVRQPTAVSYDLPLELLPVERYLVESGGPDDPLPMVLNDTPAGDAFLRAVAAPLAPSDPSVPLLVDRMRASLAEQGGVGIAAPQVGIGRRVILVLRQDLPDEPIEAYLNPRVVSCSADMVVGWEGCLSVPAGFGEVERPDSIVLTWDRVGGGSDRAEVSGWTARIFQHELDHLEGILFLDRMTHPSLLPEQEYREMRRREKEAEEATQEGGS
jgi:peptide deformylase